MTTAAPSFRPPAWLASRHLQTLAAALPLHDTAPVGARAERLRVATPEGGFLHAEAWLQPQRAPAVIVVHGVGGSPESRYVRRAAAGAFERGFHAIRLALRGAGTSLPEAPSLYHAGLGADVALVADALTARGDVDGCGTLGFSLGASVVLSDVATRTDGVGPVRACAALSPPLDLASTSRHLERPAQTAYRAYLMQSLIRQALQWAKERPEATHFDPKVVPFCTTLWKFDGEVIAKSHGLGDAATYYRRMSTGPKLAGLSVPTLVVQAKDDPMVPWHAVEPFLAARSSAVELLVSERGGHVGWVTGMRRSDWTPGWAVEQALQFLGARLR